MKKSLMEIGGFSNELMAKWATYSYITPGAPFRANVLKGPRAGRFLVPVPARADPETGVF